MTSPSPPTISFDDSGFVDGAATKPLLPKLSYAWDEMSTGMGGGNGRYKSPYMFLTRYVIFAKSGTGWSIWSMTSFC